MPPTREAITTNLAERWCWQVAQRDEARVARRLYRKALVDGVDPVDAGAVRDECLHGPRDLGIVEVLEEVRGQGSQRELGPMVPSGVLDGLQTLGGMERLQALPEWLFSAEASRRVGGFKAHQVRPGVCPRGAAQRRGPRTAGPIGPATLANTLVKRDVRGLARVCNGVSRGLAKAGGLPATVSGRVDGPDLEPTAQDEGGGQVTRQRQMPDQQGQVRAIAVTVSGWKVIVWIDAATTMPWAVQVVPRQAQATRSLRALVTHARTPLASPARL